MADILVCQASSENWTKNPKTWRSKNKGWPSVGSLWGAVLVQRCWKAQLDSHSTPELSSRVVLKLHQEDQNPGFPELFHVKTYCWYRSTFPCHIITMSLSHSDHYTLIYHLYLGRSLSQQALSKTSWRVVHVKTKNSPTARVHKGRHVREWTWTFSLHVFHFKPKTKMKTSPLTLSLTLCMSEHQCKECTYLIMHCEGSTTPRDWTSERPSSLSVSMVTGVSCSQSRMASVPHVTFFDSYPLPVTPSLQVWLYVKRLSTVKGSWRRTD